MIVAKKIFYLHAYPIPAVLSDSDIRKIFSVYGQIRRIDLHRVFIRDEAVDGHCFIEFEKLEDALKALKFEKRGKLRFETELIAGNYSLKFRH